MLWLLQSIIWVQVILLLKECRQSSAQSMYRAYNRGMYVKATTSYRLFFPAIILCMFRLINQVWKQTCEF